MGGHHQGTCKPCAFFWTEEGCKNGSACSFCHLCEQGAKKKNDKERRRRCAPWQSSSGHCFAGMLLPDDGALFSDRDRIENMRDENGWVFQSDVPRDGLHSIVVVSIFQMLDTHPEVCRLKCFCTNCMYMGIADLLRDGFVLVGAITKDVSLVRTLE